MADLWMCFVAHPDPAAEGANMMGLRGMNNNFC